MTAAEDNSQKSKTLFEKQYFVAKIVIYNTLNPIFL